MFKTVCRVRLHATYQYSTATITVNDPVIIISLQQLSELIADQRAKNTHHCQGSNLPVLICKVPKLRKPEMICAATP